MKNNFRVKIMVLILTSALFCAPLRAKSADIIEQFKKEESIWQSQGSEFLNELKGLDNIDLEKKQKKLDAEIEYNLHLVLKYVNMKECLDTALERNYKIKSYSAAMDVRKWEKKNAYSKVLPDLSYTYELQWLHGEYLVGQLVPLQIDSHPVSNNFLAGWDFVNPAKIFFGISGAKSLFKASVHRLDFTKDEIILNTAQYYYDLLGKKLEIEILKINLNESEAQLKITEGRYILGVGTKFDVLRAQAQVARSKQIFIKAFNDLRLLQARLANIMGIDVLEAVYPYELNIFTQELLDDKCDIEYLSSLAYESREDVKAKRFEIEALKAQKNVIYSQFSPDVVVQYNYGLVGLLGQQLMGNHSIRGVARVPLGRNLGVGTITEAKSYNSKIEMEKYNLEQLKMNIKEQIVNSYYNSMTTLERIEAAKKEVMAGDEGIRNALARWEIGEVTFLDVLQAQNTKTTARQELINATIEYNKAQVRLLFDSGIISVNSILKNYQLTEPNVPAVP